MKIKQILRTVAAMALLVVVVIFLRAALRSSTFRLITLARSSLPRMGIRSTDGVDIGDFDNEGVATGRWQATGDHQGAFKTSDMMARPSNYEQDASRSLSTSMQTQLPAEKNRRLDLRSGAPKPGADDQRVFKITLKKFTRQGQDDYPRKDKGDLFALHCRSGDDKLRTGEQRDQSNGLRYFYPQQGPS